MRGKILLIACAMRVEASIFINCLEDVVVKIIGNFCFYEGLYNDIRIVVLISGPGIVNMASGITIAIREYNPSAVLNYGVVGAIGENIHQGDIVIGNKCMNTGSYMTGKIDKGLGVDFNKWNFITFTDGDKDRLVLWDADKEFVSNILEIKDNYKNGNVFLGVIGSSDVWDKEHDKLVMFRNDYGIIAMDMECISVYQISNMFNIPSISVKVVSDNSILDEEYDKSVLDKSKYFMMLILDNICDNL